MGSPVGDPPLAWLVRRPWAWVTLPIVVPVALVGLVLFLLLLPVLLPWGWIRHQAYYRRRYGSRYRVIQWVARWLG